MTEAVAPPALKPGFVKWLATPYGVVLAFHAVNRAPCPDAAAREAACLLLDALEPRARLLLVVHAPLCAMSYTDPSFRAAQCQFDGSGTFEFELPRRAFAWLAAQLARCDEGGVWAPLRVRVDQSVAEALQGGTP